MLYHRVSLPRGVKETYFFDHFYAKGLNWYSHYFGDSADGHRVGEIAPTYFASAEARERLKLHLPNCRIICIFREPVARAWSHFRKLRSAGLAGESFEDEIRANVYIRETSRYAFHLQAWRERFGELNVGVFFYDDLVADPQRFADAVCRFVSVSPVKLTPEVTQFLDRNEVPRAPRKSARAHGAGQFMFWLHSRHAHRLIDTLGRIGVWQLCAGNGEEFPPLHPALETRLKEYFLPEVEALEELVGRDLSAWKPARRLLQ